MNSQNNQNQDYHQSVPNHNYYNNTLAQNYNTSPSPAPDRRGLALTALILSIIALISFFSILLPIALGISAITLGVLGIKSIRKVMAIISICIASAAILISVVFGIWFLNNFDNTFRMPIPEQREASQEIYDVMEGSKDEADPSDHGYLHTNEVLTVYSDNWLHFFQDDVGDGTIQFARRFVIVKAGDIVTNEFFDNFGFWESEEDTWPLFVHDDNYYHIVGESPMHAVVRDDLLLCLI